MKGSPILATALACLIMLGMYVGMRVVFSEEKKPVTKPEVAETSQKGEVSVFVEIYFSDPFTHFSLSHPASGKELLEITATGSTEWNGEITLPIEKLTSAEIEILGKVAWETPSDGYQFMQIVISPDNLDPQTRTLRAEGDIVDILNFHWKEDK
jgi:hypothetical protein